MQGVKFKLGKLTSITVEVDEGGLVLVSIVCNEGVYPLFVCARPGSYIAEVKYHTYFQLPVTYRTGLITQTIFHIIC